MIYNDFLKNPYFVSEMSRAIAILKGINAFPMLMEVAAMKNREAKSNNIIESQAMRASWYDGYIAALTDLGDFMEINVPQRTESVVRDFGALQTLRETEQISEEEYQHVISERTTGRATVNTNV